MSAKTITRRAFRVYGPRTISKVPQFRALAREQRTAIQAVASVLPFRVNEYVLDELVDWSRIPHDPIFQLTFPQREMLDPAAFRIMRDLVLRNASYEAIQKAAREIQLSMNPHPAGQKQLNVPRLHGETVPGIQHKYRETVLFFPSAGQTCHAYCTYCFRWAQFVGIEDLKFASPDVEPLLRYLRSHREVTDVLMTGGDPLVMKTSVLRRFVEPLLTPEFDHVTSIRLGTKAIAYWPHRFVTDADADDLLRLFEDVRRHGRSLAVMAHFSHPRELQTGLAEEAMRRLQSAGAIVRCQAPLIRHVNDDAETWASMWQTQVRLSAVPYYMFVERDTGPKSYFEVPLARALAIYRKAFESVSGLARTARGPSMSATPGKVLVDGTTRLHGRELFVLKFIQARRLEWLDEVFFAEYDPLATWLDDLQPAFGQPEFFFEPGMRELGWLGPYRESARMLRSHGEGRISHEPEDDAPRPGGWAATA